MGKVLALRDPADAGMALHDRAIHSPLTEFDGQRHPHRPAAHDDHLVRLLHGDMASQLGEDTFL
jgi:hypothetical protein